MPIKGQHSSKLPPEVNLTMKKLRGKEQTRMIVGEKVAGMHRETRFSS